MNLFWDKYDRQTCKSSFFELSYKEFAPDISAHDYDYIMTTKLSEDLLDHFPNRIRMFMLRIFELIQSTYSSEICLCSNNKLATFMQNVLEFIKLERIYLAYLLYPSRTGIPSGENSLLNTLLRFRALLKDFKLIYGFNAKRNRDDFENAKDLITQFVLYFKAGLNDLIENFSVLTPNQINLFSHEIKMIPELLEVCEKIENMTSSKNQGLNDSIDSDMSTQMPVNLEITETYSAVLHPDTAMDFKSHLQQSFMSTSKKYDKLAYERLEYMPQNFDGSYNSEMLKSTIHMNRIPMTTSQMFSNRSINNESTQDNTDKSIVQYDFYKYDKDLNPPMDQTVRFKGGLKKPASTNESVASILGRGVLNRIPQDVAVLKSIQEGGKKQGGSLEQNKKVRDYPLTRFAGMTEDIFMHFGNNEDELLKLVNIDYDVHVGLKLSSTQQQQERLKQITKEIDEQNSGTTDMRSRLVEDRSTNNNLNNNNNNVTEESRASDEEEEEVDIDIRAKRGVLERRRNGLKLEEDREFQPLKNELHGEPTLINNYMFYESTLHEYRKLEKDYIFRTENVLERPTYAVPMSEPDHCFRQDSPRSNRRQFLSSIYGEKQEANLFEKYADVSGSPDYREIGNNKNLRGNFLMEMQKDIEAQKQRAQEKTEFSRESVSYFIYEYKDVFEPCGVNIENRRKRYKSLWELVRHTWELRVFYRKLTKKSTKNVDIKNRLATISLLPSMIGSQDALIIHKTYENSFGKEVEFIAFNRLIKYDMKLDYYLNFDKILKPLSANKGLDLAPNI